MASFIQARTANEAWLQARNLLLKSPEATIVESRGGRTTELLHFTMTIKDPRQRWVFARQPGINPAFALAEAIWIISGRNDSSVLNFFNRDLPKYAGNDSTFYGAYGHRLRCQHGVDQLESAYQAFRENSATRQVVLQIWDAESDLPNSKGQPRSLDVPCNTQALLRIQNGKLYWLQIMRSNDIFRGLPYNLVQFTTLHEVMAGWLGLELGDYTHTVSCLHFYHSDYDELQKANTAADIIYNPDTLMLSKGESDVAFGFLSELISGVAIDVEKINRFAQQMDSETYSVAFRNIGNVVLAEAARRHKDFSLATNRLSQITNPCLHHLTDRCLTRFMNSQQKT